MHDVIDSPMAGREKTVTAGAAGYISLQSLTPKKPKGTFFPPVLTSRRSPRLEVLLTILSYFLAYTSATRVCLLYT